MSLANRLSSKFHGCPRRFASRPTVHFSNNLSAAHILSCNIPAAGRGLFTNYPPIYQQARLAVYLNKLLSYYVLCKSTIVSPRSALHYNSCGSTRVYLGSFSVLTELNCLGLDLPWVHGYPR